MSAISIYTQPVTNRLRYTFDLFFKEYMGLDYELLDSVDAFNRAEGARMTYGTEPVTKDLFFRSSGLLFERGVKQDETPEVIEWNGMKALYPVKDERSELPFDPFSAAFWLLSRYEEYQPFMGDRFGRFPAEQSLAYKHDFLLTPLVDYFAMEVERILRNRYPNLPEGREKETRFLPTFDVDCAFAYKSKGYIRNLGGTIKALSDFDTEDVIKRFRVMLRMEEDPFDTFALLQDIHAKHSIEPIYFFLVGEYDEHDKNISIHLTQFQELIRSVADYAGIGIHPSFASNSDPEKLEMEIERLEKVLRRPIIRSRQHFLMLKFPETYQQLLNCDIREDYTMGYPSLPGFRASYSESFYFYDLTKEVKTPLRIYPFSVMDATLQYYMHQNPSEAIATMKDVIDRVDAVKGRIIPLWHNNSLSNYKLWKGWIEVYEAMIDDALAVARPESGMPHA